jgi:casein kinase II subunit beta
MGSWVSWFCSLKGNEFFCEVDEDYIQDDFNLSGLPSQVPYYDYALELLLDADAAQDEILTEAQQAAVESAAEVLYGLIHARFVLTARGLAAMAEKLRGCDFGRCPRVLCGGQPCLPVGLSDAPRQSTVKLFCPRCEDVYYPRSKYHGNLDGAYFGTTFPHLFLLTYPALRPARPSEAYVPRVFGFKISAKAYERPADAAKPAAAKPAAAKDGAKDGAAPSGGQQQAAAAAEQQQQQQQQQDDGTEEAAVTAAEEQQQNGGADAAEPPPPPQPKPAAAAAGGKGKKTKA